MANLAASAVSRVSSRQQREYVTRRLTLTLTGQGGGTNLIPASALGFLSIESCSNGVTSDDASIYVASPNAAGSAILLASLAQGTDANRDDPADATGISLILAVTGVPA